MLKNDHQLSSDTLASNLTIIQSSIKDVGPVSSTLSPRGKPAATIIINGVGAMPKLQASIIKPVTLQDPTICEDAVKCIIQAVRDLQNAGEYTAEKPLLASISTTGTDCKRRDVSLAFFPMYHWLLAVPHADKRLMESEMVKAAPAVVRDFVIIRPSLLMDGKGVGADKLKVGWIRHPEDGRFAEVVEADAKPAIGYTIDRKDVGSWIFAELIQRNGAGWEGKCVTLTA